MPSFRPPAAQLTSRAPRRLWRLQLFSSDNPDLYKTAKAILLVGFIAQICGLGLFAIFAIICECLLALVRPPRRVGLTLAAPARLATDHVRARRAGVPTGAWTRCLWTLYAGSICVLVRGIFRCVEFGTGNGGDDKGYLLSTEGFFVRSSLFSRDSLPIRH